MFAVYRIVFVAIVTSALVPGCLTHGRYWSQPDTSSNIKTVIGLQESMGHHHLKAVQANDKNEHTANPLTDVVVSLRPPQTSEHQASLPSSGIGADLHISSLRRKRSPEGAQHVQSAVFMSDGHEKSPGVATAVTAGGGSGGVVQPDGYRQQWPTLMQEIKEYTAKSKRGGGNRIGDRFIGMRGKKLPAPSDGFVGMRGKKDDDDENNGTSDDEDDNSSIVADDVATDYGHHKRPSPDAFYAMRGKKDDADDDDDHDHDDDVDDIADAAKRSPKDGFLGMRGKKLRDEWKSRINNIMREIDDDGDDVGGGRRRWTSQQHESMSDNDDNDDEDEVDVSIGSRPKKNAHFDNFLQKWANQLRRRRMTRDDHRNRHVDDMFIGMRG